MASITAFAGENSVDCGQHEFSGVDIEVGAPEVSEIAEPTEKVGRPVVKKRVLIIVENQTVPRDPRVWREARSLSENGYEVSVICPRRSGSSQGYEVIEGVRIYRHPSPKEARGAAGYLWEYSCALFWEFLYTWWVYLRHGLDVIQGCNPPDLIFLVALPFRVLGIKYIFDHHDANPELYLSKFGKKGFFYTLLLKLENLSYRCSDAVMATNLSYRDVAIQRGRVPSDKVFVVRNGPELETFKPVPPNPVRKFGKKFLVGYVGNMSFQDGLDILLNVAEHIKNMDRRDVHFTCVGTGTELESLRKMVRDMALSDMVTFTGRVSDEELLEVLSTADVCVNPDRPSEMNDMSTMIKIMEYMVLGKPIVQFESKEGRYSAKEASLYASKEDGVADFAAKIIWLLDRPEERKKMGEVGRKRIEEQLAWEYSVPQLLAAYQEALHDC
jgi:glycosyltransferase involved in cell wall biosynthesis